jgi:hypothetical protein
MGDNTAPVQGTPSVEQLLAEREKMNAEIARLRAEAATQNRNTFSVSVSAVVNETDAKGNVIRVNGKPKTKPGKGGVKVSGLGSRFPVTLYPEQWQIIFDNQDKIKACIQENAALIKQLRSA